MRLFYERNNAMSQTKPCILLTFDDQHVDAWFDTLPMLEKYDAKVTFYQNNLDQLTDEQIDKVRKIQQAGHTIACHGWRHVWPVKHTEEFGVEHFWDVEVQPCLDWYDAHDFKIKNYAYAFNNYNEQTNARLFDRFDRFRCGVGQVDRTDIASFEPAFLDLIFLPKQRLVSGMHIDTIVRGEPKEPIPMAVLSQVFDRLVDRNQYMTFYGHNIDTGNEGHYTEPEFLEQMVKLAKEKGIACMGMDDLPAVER